MASDRKAKGVPVVYEADDTLLIASEGGFPRIVGAPKVDRGPAVKGSRYRAAG